MQLHCFLRSIEIQGLTALVTLPNGEGAQLLTVGGELDKLVSNVGHGRDFAGVHYRVDEQESFKMGEQIALRYLQDRARRYHERGFTGMGDTTGFELTLRDGTRVRVTPEAITVI